MTIEIENLEELEELEDEEFMATLEHDVVAGNIHTALKIFLKDKDLGRAFGGSAEYRFIQSADIEVSKKFGKQPDVSFLTKAKLPERLRGYPDLVPDLAVEVTSPTDRDYMIEAKVAFYQDNGVKLVWLVHPYSRRVAVYRLTSGLNPESLGEGEELSGEDVLAGFKLPISEIFDYPPDPNPLPDSKPKKKDTTA